MSALAVTLATAATSLFGGGADTLDANRWLTGSTAYCLRGRMADGSYVRWGSAANNRLRLGTRIRVFPRVFGLRRWVIRDRIGWGTPLDFWTPSCSAARRYGRRTVRVYVGW